MYDIMHLPGVIEIGRTGENDFRAIRFDMRPWLQVLPDGVASIIHIRPGETSSDSYIAATTFTDGILEWKPTNADLGEVEGYGQMEIWLEEPTESEAYRRGKSVKVQTFVQGSIGPGEADPPEPQESWMEQMTELKTDTVIAKEAAEDAQAAAETAEENAEAWAVGQRDGVDVGSTDPAYHNNSKYYSEQSAGSATDAANARTAAETAQGKAETAQGKAEIAQEKAEYAMGKYPQIDDGTGDWMVWNPSGQEYSDTGVHAKGDTGTVPDIEVGTVTTLLPGAEAYVTRRSGSPDEAPVFDFGIPKGDTGQAENIYGNTIDMSEEDSTKVATEIGKKAAKVTGATSGNFAALDGNGDLVDSGHKHSDYITDVSGKADKVSGATSGNFAGLDADGNLTDSGSKASDFLTSSDITGKADKVTSATNGNFAALDGDGNLTDSGHKHSDYVTDISGKADKVSGATSGNFAALDANGNLTDSGSKSSDFNLTKGTVSNANSDMDNGLYYTTSNSQNVPNSYGILLNIKASGTAARRFQLCFNGTDMWYRFGAINNNVLTWNGWMKVTATAV